MQTQSVSREIQPLADVASLALEEARRQGASECEADASLGRGLSVSVRLREVDTLEHQRDRGLAVTVYFGKRKGSASTADLSTSAVRETVEKACAIARYTAEDPAAGLALDPRLANSEGAAVNSQRQTGVYGNSLGFLAGYSATSHSVSCTLIAAAGEDMQRDYWFTIARDPTELEGVASVGRTAGVRAVARLGARRLTTRKVPVAFSPDVARGLFRHFVGAISGTSQYRKSSFLLNAAGEQIFPAFLQMQERPHIRKGLASSPFDQEGAATRDRELVRDGVVSGYVLGSYSARRLGLTTTGNAGGVHNLIVTSAEGALDAAGFLNRLDTGLLVTELMGQGVNGVTGDYSRGAAICATAMPGRPSSVARRFTLQRRPPATCARPTKYISLSASCSSSTLESRSCCRPRRRYVGFCT